MSPDALIEGAATVSDKIRRLNEAGYPRAEIARLLGKRYQHVRNVLEGDRQRPSGGTDADATSASPLSSPGGVVAEPVRVGDLFRLEVQEGGYVKLPQAVIESFKLKAGRTVIAQLRDGRFSLLDREENIRLIRSIPVPERTGESLLSDELIADRRREDARD